MSQDIKDRLRKIPKPEDGVVKFFAELRKAAEEAADHIATLEDQLNETQLVAIERGDKLITANAENDSLEARVRELEEDIDCFSQEAELAVDKVEEENATLRQQLDDLKETNRVIAELLAMEKQQLSEAQKNGRRYLLAKSRAYKDGDTLSLEIAVITDRAIGDFGEFIDTELDTRLAAASGEQED